MSTVDQDTALQLDAFARASVLRVHEEKLSAVGARPELARVLYTLRRGDTLVVYKVDRLARSLSDLLRLLARLESLGVSFRSLTEPIDTATPVGRMMLQILGSFAEFERSMIRERCAAGRAAARARGVHMGRPRKVDVSRLPALVAEGMNATQIATIFNCDRSSVAHWLSRCGLT